MKTYLSCVVLFSGIICFVNSGVQPQSQTVLDDVYKDESHCLVGPEIRKESDNPISCYCRDALTDARYVYHNYLLTGKDRNLNGALLTLQQHASEMCSQEHSLIWDMISAKEWRWKGPEVTRTYPSDVDIERIKADSKGWRTVPYSVRLTFRDASGTIIKSENFSAVERFPPNFRK